MIPESKKTEFSSYTPEELRELYKQDPDHFEEIAEGALKAACTGRTPEQTLRRQQMQWTIDAQLRKARTPLGRLQAMENIFYSRVFGAEGELAQLMSNCTDLVRALTGTDQVRVGAEAERVPKRRPVLYLLKK
jgi:hypothetical protein